LGIGFVYDQRDPYIDFQIATGTLKEDSMEERKIIALHHLEAMWTDHSVFPSEVYHKDMVLRGLSARRGLGVVRGVDINAFNPDVQGEGIREALGIEHRFVVGWFGMMTSYRLIEEVLIPLIESVDVSAPDVHFIIGGSGELMQAFKSLKERRPDVRMTLLGHVPHQDLPRYLAACELLLCPLNTNNLFSSNASPLKILEALAVGRPVIATSVKVRYKDFSELRGIVWTGKTLPEFIGALTHVRERYPELRATAEAQARDFDRFSTKSNISKIVDGIESVCK
jgi:glycosyltransferase involved in cell wall biosynthesis